MLFTTASHRACMSCTPRAALGVCGGKGLCPPPSIRGRLCALHLVRFSSAVTLSALSPEDCAAPSSDWCVCVCVCGAVGGARGWACRTVQLLSSTPFGYLSDTLGRKRMCVRPPPPPPPSYHHHRSVRTTRHTTQHTPHMRIVGARGCHSRRYLASLLGSAAGAALLGLEGWGALPALFAARALAGLSKHSGQAANALIVDYTQLSRRSVEFGRMQTAATLGMMIAPTIGGFLYHVAGEAALVPALVSTAFLLVAALLGLYLLPDSAQVQVCGGGGGWVWVRACSCV